MRISRALPVLVAAASLAGLAGESLAEGASVLRPRTFGTLDPVAYRIPSSDFTTTSSNVTWEYDAAAAPTTRRYSSVRLGEFIGPVHIPTGALVTLIELDYCDTLGPGANVTAILESYKKDGSLIDSLAALQSNDDGCALVFTELKNPYQMANDREDLVVRVLTEGGNSETSFTGVTLYYSLQMSPAPAGQTFADVPNTYLFFRTIEAMARSGITVGCGSGNYCPDQSVTRGEMAAFFSRALGLHFPDVPPGP